MKSSKTLLSAICISYLAALTPMAHAADSSTKTPKLRYLDPGIWHIVVDQKKCFHAAPSAMLTVEPIGPESSRTYSVSQFFDRNIQHSMYTTPLDDQIKQRKFVGEEFCNGIVSISDMDLPITKGDSISDANDGILLEEAARHATIKVLEEVNAMTVLASQAASGTYSFTELSVLNTEFQAHMAIIQNMVNTTRLNKIMLLDGSHESVDVPIDNGQNHVSILLSNFSTGSSGLNIGTNSLDTDANAQNALASLNAITSIITEYGNLNAAQIQLAAAQERNAVTTLIDLTTDKFTVQIKKPDNKAGRR